ncbi:hypothetical protein LMTR3_21250 [Bradyrhizobium sp. LMTR 3]|nr:hypothetical protein LMTR3_21250 [Bradyrhizobium sp. LMTR 3]
MDVAKLVALRVGSGKSLASVYGVGFSYPRGGTSSEVRFISVITTYEGEKKGVSSPVLLPDLARLDAELPSSRGSASASARRTWPSMVG